MMRNFCFKIGFFLAITCNGLYAQEGPGSFLTVALENSFLPLQNKNSWVTSFYKNLENLSPEAFKNIPQNLKGGAIRIFDFQPEQGLYEVYRTGKSSMSRDQLVQKLNSYQSDTTKLSSSPTLHRFWFLVADRIDGKRIVIMDTNNNRDFGDEKLMIYDPDADPELQDVVPESQYIVLKYQLVDEGKINDITGRISFDPFMKGSVVKVNNKIDNYPLALKKEYKSGILKAANSSYMFVLRSSRSNRYGNDSPIFIGEANAADRLTNFYNVGDTVNIEHNYIINAISRFGDTLILRRVNAETVGGVYETQPAANIVSTDLKGQPFNLHGLKGKHVLLDFWGTWCGPCIASIPDLLALNEAYKDKLQIVSVAYDRSEDIDKLKSLIADRKLNWVHLLQEKGKPVSTQDIIRLYKIDAFPTQILIDQYGEIVLRTTGIEGVDKVKKILELAEK